MANNNSIKGITIEIGASTEKLTKALSDVSKNSTDLQKELKQVDKALKFDPGNSELIAQKMQILSERVSETSNRLDVLKNTQKQVDEQFKKGTINDAQYRAFNRELVETENVLNSLKSQLQGVQNEQTNISKSTKQLETLFKATKTSVDDFSEVLGTKLSNAIKNGTASAKQLEKAIDIVGQNALDTSIDLDKMRNALEGIDKGVSLSKVSRELRNLSKEAQKVEHDFSKLKQGLSDVGSSVGGMAASVTAGVGALTVGMQEANTQLAMLETQVKLAGMSMEDIAGARNAFATINADVDQVTEAIGNLYQAGYDTSESFTEMGKTLSSVVIKYGKTFSIENLAETITTATNLGEATGQLLDLLEKEGINVDDFEAKLTSMSGATDRAAYIQELLSKQVSSTYDEFVKTNPELEKSAQAQQALQDAMSKLSEVLTPLVTEVTNFITKIVDWAAENPKLMQGITIVAGAITGLVGAFTALTPFITVISGLALGLGTSFGAIAAPIGIAIAAITALGIGLTTLWQNSETFRTGVTTVFESIKNVATTVFETVASFIGEKIAQIKQFWDENGAQILEAASNAFNGIKDIVDFVMPAIEFIIETVWNAIQNIIDGGLNIITGLLKTFSGLFTGDFSKMWEGVKDIFGGAIDVIIGWMSLTFVGGIRTLLTNLLKNGVKLVKNLWDDILLKFKSAKDGAVKYVTELKTNFVNKIKSMKDDVVKKATEIKDGFVKKIKEINLLQIGKDIVNGLIKGVSSMFNSVKKTIGSLASIIPDSVKDFLGIHSPSRVMMELGEWIGIGLAEGIQSTEKVNEQITRDISEKIIATKESYQKESLKVDKELADKVKAVNKKANDAILKIQKNANKKNRKLTKEENAEILSIREDANYEIEKLEEKAASDRAKIAANEKKDIEGHYKELLDSIKSFIDDKKSLNQLSLVDEVEIWSESMALFDGATDQRIAAQNAYKSALQALNDEIVSINTKYTSEVTKINEDYIKQEQEMTKAYEDAVNKRKDALTNFASLFDQYEIKVEKSGIDLINNLRSQVVALNTWRHEMDALSKRGVLDDGLLSEISDMGVGAVDELIELNRLTDAQLTEYNNLFKEKLSSANEQAEKEYANAKGGMEFALAIMGEQAETQLTKIQAEWAESIKGIRQTTEDELMTLETIGRQAGEGLLNGLSSMADPLRRKAEEIANNISKTIKDALKVKSPSRVMIGIGENVGEGLIIGIDDMVNKVAQSSSRLVDAVVNAHNSLSSAKHKSQANQIVQQQIIERGSTIDLNGLVAAITQLADRPILVSMDGRGVTNTVSTYQLSDINLKSFRNGVLL